MITIFANIAREIVGSPNPCCAKITAERILQQMAERIINKFEILFQIFSIMGRDHSL